MWGLNFDSQVSGFGACLSILFNIREISRPLWSSIPHLHNGNPDSFIYEELDICKVLGVVSSELASVCVSAHTEL